MNKKYSSNAGIQYDADAVVVLCKCLTFNNINISTKNDVIDSIEIKKGDIIALGGQTDNSQNGIYVSTGVHLVRHPLFNNETNMLSHIAVVTNGTYKNYRLYISVVGTVVNVELGAYDEGSLYQGVLDASAGIPYPAATEGMFWRISVAGVIGTVQVEVGDQVIAIADYDGGMDDTKFMVIQTNTQVTSVTYAQLKTLIENEELEAGRHYLITDFATAYNIFDGGTNTVIENKVADNNEPLEVVAIGVDALAREAYSFAFPSDIIHYNAYAKPAELAAFIAAGDVGYIDAGDVVPNFKGVIEFRHDTKQNVSAWYDFRNVKFRRWAVDAVAYDAGTAYVAKDVCKSGVDGKIYKCLTATTGEGDPTVNTADWILWWDITVDTYISWTTDNTKFNIGDINTTNLIFVPATYQDVYTFGSWYQHVNNVTIGKNDLALVKGLGYNSTLNNIVFKTTDDLYTCYDNEIGHFNYNNTIGNYFSSNTIGDGFYSNAIGNYFYSNTIGNGFYSNAIGNAFTTNTIGNGFRSNTIGNGFYSNAIGNDFTTNTIGNGFYFNTIGDGFYSNAIGNDFTTNAIGNGFRSNTIGDGFYSNAIGNDFTTNAIGNGFYFNTIGNNSKVAAGDECKSNYIGDYNTQVTLGDNCTGISVGEKNGTITLGATNTDMSIGNGNTTVTIGDYCTGCTIGNGNDIIVFGASNSNIFVGDGNAITTGANCLSIDIGESNTITLGTGCVNLTFLNGCVFNTNTAPNGLQDNIFESGTNISAVNFTTATHIKAAYNTTVFMNATPEAKLSYFNASNALTVVNVNA